MRRAGRKESLGFGGCKPSSVKAFVSRLRMIEDGYPLFSVFHVHKYHTSDTCTHIHACMGDTDRQTDSREQSDQCD